MKVKKSKIKPWWKLEKSKIMFRKKVGVPRMKSEKSKIKP